MAARSKTGTVFAGSNTGIVASNPILGMNVCVRLFYVSAVLCVQVAALRQADPPFKESYRPCERSKLETNWTPWL
jgi:hypothetical protein